MMQNKKGLNSAGIGNYAMIAIMAVIGIVVLLQVLAALFPTLITAGTTLNSSGFPLGNLFVRGGAVWYILAAFAIIAVVSMISGKKK